jgi:hypothetical protein
MIVVIETQSKGDRCKMEARMPSVSPAVSSFAGPSKESVLCSKAVSNSQ